VVAHPSADLDVLRVALIRGAFEYQGQKRSAASRAYIPPSVWSRLRDELVDEVEGLTVGDVTDFHNLMSAVIDDRSFAKLRSVLNRVRGEEGVEIVAGGTADDSEGYFVPPTSWWPTILIMRYSLPNTSVRFSACSSTRTPNTTKCCGSPRQLGRTG